MMILRCILHLHHQGGSIPGAINIPYHTLNTQLDHLRRVAQAVPLVIFHCMQSQIRGPKAARRYQNFTQSNQTVCVLRGGFYSWRHRYPHLVENYDAKFWEDNNY